MKWSRFRFMASYLLLIQHLAEVSIARMLIEPSSAARQHIVFSWLYCHLFLLFEVLGCYLALLTQKKMNQHHVLSCCGWSCLLRRTLEVDRDDIDDACLSCSTVANESTHHEVKVVVSAWRGKTGGYVVRWWPAGAVRGAICYLCGRYDATDDMSIRSADTYTVSKNMA